MPKFLNMILGRRGAFDARTYWDRRYKDGGDSGSGSSGALADYKARVLNDFVAEHGIRSVLEFGCGDGRQLAKMGYPSYVGLDVSETAVARCTEDFAGDSSKRFSVYTPGALPASLRADLSIALDVLYHIVDDADFERTLDDVFASAEHHVILYTNVDPRRSGPSRHVRYRDTLRQLERFSDFAVREILENEHPRKTRAQFIILSRQSGSR